MKKLLRTVATAATVGLASLLIAAPAAAQGNPQLQIDRIWNQGALTVGGTNVFRANVRNSSQTTPARGRIKVVLNILDPDQKKSTYETSMLNLGPNGAQAVAFHKVKLSKPGAYIVTVIVDPDAEFSRGTHYPAKSNERTQTFTVGAPNDAGVYRLIVTVKQKGTGANGMRVAVKTADGQELAWRQTTLTGQAQFPRLAPSPHGKPYTIEVKRLANVLATQTFAMPAKDAQFEINLDAASRKN